MTNSSLRSATPGDNVIKNPIKRSIGNCSVEWIYGLDPPPSPEELYKNSIRTAFYVANHDYVSGICARSIHFSPRPTGLGIYEKSYTCQAITRIQSVLMAGHKLLAMKENQATAWTPHMQRKHTECIETARKQANRYRPASKSDAERAEHCLVCISYFAPMTSAECVHEKRRGEISASPLVASGVSSTSETFKIGKRTFSVQYRITVMHTHTRRIAAV